MTFKKLFANVYSIFVGLSLFGGFVVFLFILAGFVVGGADGASIMAIARTNIIPRLYQLASIGVISGMILLYVTNDHDLTLAKKDKKAE
jgi:hypothetical protein